MDLQTIQDILSELDPAVTKLSRVLQHCAGCALSTELWTERPAIGSLYRLAPGFRRSHSRTYGSGRVVDGTGRVQ